MLDAAPDAADCSDLAHSLNLTALLRELHHVGSDAELYDAIAKWAFEHATAGRASVTIVTPDRSSIEIVTTSGLTSGGGNQLAYRRGETVPLAGSAVEHVMSTGRTHVWHPSEHGPESEGPRLAAAGWGTVSNAPIRVDGDVIGTFNLLQPVGWTLDEHLVRASEDVAEFIAVNLERLRLSDAVRDELERSRASAARLSLLTEVAVELSAVHDEDRILELVAAVSSRIVPTDRVNLAIPNADAQTLTVARLLEPGRPVGELPLGTALPIENSAIGDVYRSGRSRVYPHLEPDRYPEHRLLDAAGFVSGFCIPVAVDGRVGAVISAASREAYQLDGDEVRALEALAGLAGANLERVRAQSSAAEQSERFRELVDGSPLLMMTVGPDGRIMRMSRFGAARLGYDGDRLVAGSLAALYTDAHRDDALAAVDQLLAARPGTVTTWVADMHDANGAAIAVRHTGRRMIDADGADEPCVLLVCEDVSELLAMSEQLEHQASHDPLTGLVNRREFERRLAELAVDDRPLSLCFIDVDRFKLVNDTAGHQAGDELLVEIANLLGGAISKHDTLARIGGDEFALVLPGCSLPDAVRVAERLRARASTLVKSWGGHTFPASLSIGVAGYQPELGTDALVTEADAACYEAKSTGRNRVAIAKHPERVQRRDGDWVQRVRDALAADDLLLAAQPIAALDRVDAPANFEVLVRLLDKGEIIPAGVFIPPTERYGLITDIDRWVVAEVIRVLAEYRHIHERIGFCTINLSAKSIENESFLEDLLELLSAGDIPPELLVFEITETTALSQFTTAVRFVESVSALGCRFALDDFGAGFSTYQYLKQLPVQMLKIDGSLVRDIAIDPVNREIVRSMTQVATAIGMQTVAEFVEDATTSDLLLDLGVDYAQGWGIGKPRMIDELLGDLTDGRSPLDARSAPAD